MEVLVWIAIAIICAVIAGKKGRSTGTWFVLGLFFGILALIILAFLKPLKKCIGCGKSVDKDSRLCMYCGYDFYK